MKDFFEFRESLNEIADSEVLTKVSRHKYDPDKKQTHLTHDSKKIISHLKKDPKIKKHLGYMDDADLVHKKTQKTMVNIHKKTMGDVKKHLHAYIDKHHPDTSAGTKHGSHTVTHSSDTRSIIHSPDMDHANKVKSTHQSPNHKVRIMKRSGGKAKVYVDSKSADHHKAFLKKLGK